MAGETRQHEHEIDQARRHLAAGRVEDAQMICRAILRDAPDDPAAADAQHLLGVMALSAGRTQEAIEQITAAIARRPDAPEYHNNLGEALRRAGQGEAAIESYRRAIALRGDYPQAWHNLALALLDRNDPAAAAEAAAQATRFDPQYARAFCTLGTALREQQRPDDAHAAFTRALELKPDYRAAHSGLAHVLWQQGRFESAAEMFHRLAAGEPRDLLSRSMLGECLVQLRRFDDAEEALRSALALSPDDAALARRLAGVLDIQGRAEEAIEQFRQVSARSPQAAPLARLLAATRLPVVYRSADDVRRWRQRCLEQMDELHREGVRVGIENTVVPPLFFSAYQGMEDIEVQRAYARLIEPQPPLELPPPRRGAGSAKRIRVGFLSSYFRAHTIGRINKGTIAELSREQFEVVVFSVGRFEQEQDARFIREHADEFVFVPNDLPQARRIVAEKNLDVLLYTDQGMDEFTYTLAFSRLAPVQAVTWGHPCTSGGPAIDDYISSELLETPAADAHYTERLVRLNNLSVFYYRPTIDGPAPRLSDFGFAGDENVYACLQMLFKIHPDFDEILDEILRRDPRGVVVLPQGASRHWQRMLRQRFARTMPRTHERVRFIAPMKYDQYLRFCAACPVLLAPVHFGAGNTSYEAFAFGTPTVTMPSPYLKGRITYGLYKAMGVMDCVADSPEQYADLAVRLGTDAEFSHAVRQKILSANQVLYENPAGVRDLEAYFRSVARGR